jgi:hypothetical protein
MKTRYEMLRDTSITEGVERKKGFEALDELLAELTKYFCWPLAMAKVADGVIELSMEVDQVRSVFRLRIDLDTADGKPVFTFRGKQYRNPGQKYDLGDAVYLAIREAIAGGTDGKVVDIGSVAQASGLISSSAKTTAGAM